MRATLPVDVKSQISISNKYNVHFTISCVIQPKYIHLYILVPSDQSWIGIVWNSYFPVPLIVLLINLNKDLRWLPMVLFSYNRIYRDQTLSARITRGMFVASYNKIFHIQSWKHCFCRYFCVSTHKKDGSSSLQSFVFPSSSIRCFKSVLKQFLGPFLCPVM